MSDLYFGIDSSRTRALAYFSPALIWKADAQTRKDRILAEFTANEIRFAHVVPRRTRRTRSDASAFHTRLRPMREQVREGWLASRHSRLERGRCSGSPPIREYVRQITCIMMLYCIQIRMPTAGYRHEDSFVPRKCTTGVARTTSRLLFYFRASQHCKIRWEVWTKSLSLKRK